MNSCSSSDWSWTRTYVESPALSASNELTQPARNAQTTTDPNHPKDEPHQLKIEVPANRYDLLCLEGIVRALKLYLHPEIGSPTFTLKPAPQVRSSITTLRPV